LLKTADFDYFLPPDLIAQKPADKRELARLLVDIGRKSVHAKFSELGDYLSPGDLLVFNDTKVIPARLLGKKETGGQVEVFLLKQLNETDWEVLVKPAKRVKLDTKIIFKENVFEGQIIEVLSDGKRLVRFAFKGDFWANLDEAGLTPLPPYIKQDLERNPSLKERYQTVYAKQKGAVAAPTAGLHFSDDLISALRNKGINTAFVTLHVGIGTFRPVEVEQIDEHEMHPEYCVLSAETIAQIKQAKENKKRVVAVGTTTTRLLEGIWQKYKELRPVSEEINIFITPGYQFKVIDALITNFHLPKSTLLMLVSAFIGKERAEELYSEAIDKKYHFYSFGDAMLLYGDK
jgi:S-adenosylmethionine:tRNA ribosyltransferase-isomerase